MSKLIINIDDVTSECMYSTRTNVLSYSEDIKKIWNDLTTKERYGYHEAKRIPLSQKLNKLDHKTMLKLLAEELESTLEIEEDILWDEVDDNNAKLFRDTLNQIFGHIRVYVPTNEIDFTSEFTGRKPKQRKELKNEKFKNRTKRVSESTSNR